MLSVNYFELISGSEDESLDNVTPPPASKNEGLANVQLPLALVQTANVQTPPALVQTPPPKQRAAQPLWSAEKSQEKRQLLDLEGLEKKMFPSMRCKVKSSYRRWMGSKIPMGSCGSGRQAMGSTGSEGSEGSCRRRLKSSTGSEGSCRRGTGPKGSPKPLTCSATRKTFAGRVPPKSALGFQVFERKRDMFNAMQQ